MNTTIQPTKEQQAIDLRKSIAARFDAWLTHNKMSMSHVARESGITLPGLSLVRSGVRLPRASTLYGLSKVGMDLNWLVTGEVKQYENGSINGKK